MAKKRKTSLPRVTLMAYNRRDLVAFVSAVETLRLLVQDLRTVTDEMKVAATRQRRKKLAQVTDQADELLDKLIPRKCTPLN